ncbi:hypothetical protein DNX69_11305 [Rhodopseudomonas palustris]|uniref:Cation transporter n=1 Tax=Rhodopseudomonas palustris TaxID=1076 RepID=A0A323UFR9_RHOPL|nr:hypothetical protein [Rhodopseudomonas palustris]PZA11705.1 hypothetical protein DNX69_11305 [Rhodopseudomonas palustris]
MVQLSGFAALIEALRPIRRHLIVAHHVRGRIRVRLAPSGYIHLTPQLLQTLQAGARSDEIASVRVNSAALSVVVEYAPDRLAPDLWDLLINAPDDELDDLIAGNAARHREGERHVG